MSEAIQEQYNSIDPDGRSEARRRIKKKRASLKNPLESKGEGSELSNLEGSELLCEDLGISNKNRLLLGFVGLAFVVPYCTLSLAYPQWAGHIGGRLSTGLFSLLGQGASLVPVLLGYLVLSCAGLRTLKKTRYVFVAPLFVSLVILIERWVKAGGWLGGLLDGAALAAVGPGGAWLLTGTALVLATLGFFPRAWGEMLQLAAFSLEQIREYKLRLQTWWDERPIIEDPEPQGEEAKLPSEEISFRAPETKAAPLVSAFTTSDSLEVVEPLEPLDAPVPVNEVAVAPPPATPTMPEGLPPIPAPPEPPVQKNSIPQVTTETAAEFGPTEIGESAEFPPKKLTNSDEAQAAVPRARHFELPPLVLLDDIPSTSRVVPSEDKSQALLDALDAFGVKAKLLQIVRGPAVTRYELQPARGVKVSKFTSLTNDIALALASTSVRIEAPIPGKSAIGIEIPNKHTDLVVLKDILRDTTFGDSKGLTVALGKDLSGRPVVTDLQKMPHLLVAGTTGSGKSVCVNGLIISLLYRFTPDQLQLMMVDPKQVELSVYGEIPHLVGFDDSEGGEIIVDPKKAAQALHQVVELMEERYTLFAEAKVRNLAEYNVKSEDPLPWFVVIIDELADLMMVASKSVETSICRIAQKARAAGIHLVLATQRPSADVLTGLIKVNIPSRAAFAVSSGVDSRVILDSSGAEHLLGKGDMLFLPVDASDPRRLQGCYVGNDEIARVVEFWKGQGIPDNHIEFELKPDILADDNEEEDTNSDDALIQEALRVILNRDQASASMLQTELKVGYARARRLINAMEKKGWIGPPEGSKPRKITYTGPGPDAPAES